MTTAPAAAKVEHLFPLSPSQTGMWLQSLAAPASHAFIEQIAWCIEGDLDDAVLQQAWQAVADRHVALRSAILHKGETPLQAVLRHVPISWQVADLDCRDEDAVLDALMHAERARGFVLNRPPLLRLVSLRCNERRHWCLLSFHHIILDGWSLPLLWADVAQAYQARVTGQPLSWSPAADFRQYVSWLKARDRHQAERWWRQQLQGFVVANPIVHATASSGDAIEYSLQLDEGAGSVLASVARRCQVSSAVVFEVLWGVLLAGRCGDHDVVFGATVSGRPAEVEGIEHMAGCFINTVPVRLRLNASVSLAATLSAHHALRAEQADYESCSAGQIHAWSSVSPGQPLYQSLLVYENLPPVADDRPALASDALSIVASRQFGGRTSTPLCLLVSPGTRPHLRFVFSVGAIKLDQVAQLADQFASLVHALPRALDLPVAHLLAGVPASPIAPLPDAIPATQPYVAPRTRRELELAAIWESLLQRSPISVLDDFFALGGHSLLALQLVARVRSELGVELPLQKLAGGASIERIAGLLDQAGSTDSWLPLAQGDGVPVVCLHPLFGHVLCYAALARQLAGRHPVIGIQAPGLEAGEPVAASWDALLDHHWALLRCHLQCREVVLLGYSYGGYLALELAQRMIEAGWPAPQLVLLDVPHPSVIPAQPLDRIVLLHSLFGHGLQLDLSALQQMPPAEVLPYVRQLAIARHLLPAEASVAQIERLLDVALAHASLWPPIRKYDLDVTLLRARDLPDRISPLADLGWGRYVRQLRLAWVAGSHETMLDAAHIAGLTTELALSSLPNSQLMHVSPCISVI